LVAVERSDLENRFFELERLVFEKRRDIFPAHLFTPSNWLKWSLYVNNHSWFSRKDDDLSYFMAPILEFIPHTPDNDGVCINHNHNHNHSTAAVAVAMHQTH
jgi:hypothetical protein